MIAGLKPAKNVIIGKFDWCNMIKLNKKSCLNCVGPLNNDCISCQVDSTTKRTNGIGGNPKGTCPCSINYFDDGVNMNCAICHNSCKSCNGSLATNCITCAD